MAKAKRSAKAHAEGRIVNNGHSGVPSQDASGGVEGPESLGAGTPEDSRNISGDVSGLEDGLATTEGESRKGSSRKSVRKSNSQNRRKVLARALSGEFSAAKNFVEDTPLTGGSDGGADRVDDESDGELSVFSNLADLDLGSESGRQSALEYLTSGAVTRWMAKHSSSEALQTMIDDLLQKQPKVAERVAKSPQAPAPPKAEPTRKRVAPAQGSAADLGNQYRLGQPGIIGALAAAQFKKLKNVTENLAGAAAGVAEKSPPVGCKTQDQHDLEELAFTARRVLQRRPDLASLPRDVRLRKVASMAARELHKAGLDRVHKNHKESEGDGGGDGGSDGSPSISSGGSGGTSVTGSESVGDTVGSGTSSSGSSVGSYSRRDPFVKSDSNSSGDSDSDLEGTSQRKKREQQRRGSMNGLGTPRKSKTVGSSKQTAAAAAPAPAAAASDRVMMFCDDDLKMWTIGTAAYKQGLNWEAYVHHKQAYDNYMQHKGKWSERTFKSIIHAKLVPTVCATCGFLRGKWHKVDDARLILKLEKVLRPSRSTDCAVELRALRLIKHKHAGEPLIARYEVFAEKFIYKCSEAEDAGKRIKPNVIKAAFKAEVEKESVLKHWLQEVQWKGVERAHRRLLRKLREARSVEQLFNGGKAGSKSYDDAGEGSDENTDKRPVRRKSFRERPDRHLSNAVMKRRLSTARSKNNNGNGRGFGGGNGGAAKAPAKGDKGPKIRTWTYDKRGASWHTDADLYECYDRPCQRPFCQRCRAHGHTAEYCRKADDTPGLTREGYAQENAKGKAALQAPPPARQFKSNKARGFSKRSHLEDDAGSEGDSDHDQYTGRQNHAGRRSKGSQCGSDDDEGRSGVKGHGDAAREGRRSCL